MPKSPRKRRLRYLPDATAIEQLRGRFRAQLANASTAADLKSLQDEFLSRKAGIVTGLMKTLGTLAPDARREFGQLVNTLKTDIETFKKAMAPQYPFVYGLEDSKEPVDLKVMVRGDNGPGFACRPYTLSYTFDAGHCRG